MGALALSLHLGASALGGGQIPDWVTARYVADFENDRYWRNGPATFDDVVGLTRTTEGYALSSTGYEVFAVDTPRLTDLGLTLEPTRSPGLRYSADISNAAWTAEAGLSKSSPGGAAAIEGQAVTRLTWASGNGRISSVMDITNGQTRRVMALVHVEPQVPSSNPARYGCFRTAWADAGGTNHNYVFDTNGSGSVGFQSTGSSNAAITEVFPGWWLMEMDLLCGKTLTVQSIFFYMSNNNVTNDTFVAPSAALTWDVAYIDAIAGAGASTPIVSGNVPAARGADVATLKLPAAPATSDLLASYDVGNEVFSSVPAGDYSVTPANLDRPLVTRFDWGAL